MKNTTIGILGGGLAGLTTAIHLATKGLKVIVIEKYTYPHHKVCGEYISKEVFPYLNALGISFNAIDYKDISTLSWTTVQGKIIHTKLPLGGLGISRYALDNLLYKKAKYLGAICIKDTALQVDYTKGMFTVFLQNNKPITCNYVIGAYGKRSTLDKKLNRPFIEKKSKWMAIKMHYKHPNFKDNEVQLHNFNGGYCGLSKVETNAVNLCCLTTIKAFKTSKRVKDFEQQVLSQNKWLSLFLKDAKPIFKDALTIAQISFKKKAILHNHIPMIGDAAALIHPLCGNGMAMAIHSAKIVSETLLESITNNYSRQYFEKQYIKLWKKTFKRRLLIGRCLQFVLLHPYASKIAIYIVGYNPKLLQYVIRLTHGKPIQL